MRLGWWIVGLSLGCTNDVSVVSCETPTTYYRDADGDGYGHPDLSIDSCVTPNGYANNDRDCDDEVADVHPGAQEICNDGVDDDCDGDVDDADADLDVGTADTWYPDLDHDGYGAGEAVFACSDPSTDLLDFESDYDDCDDEDAELFPGRSWVADCDGDGHFGPTPVVACTSTEAVSPCGGGQSPIGGWTLDTSTADDCDDEDADEFPQQVWYADCDDDDAFREGSVIACDQAGAEGLTPCTGGVDPAGGWSHQAPDPADCDDENADEFPLQVWYADCDGDGAPRATSVSACEADAASVDGPCGDGVAPQGGWTHDAPEVPDCDDDEPLEVPGKTWYADCDGDDFHGDVTAIACDTDQADLAGACDGGAPLGGWSDSEPTTPDCDDLDALVFPGQSWYADCDGDAYFGATSVTACDETDASSSSPCPGGASPQGEWTTQTPDPTDCDDTDSDAVPGAVWYADCDGDEYFGATSVEACSTSEAAMSSPCAGEALPAGEWTVTEPVQVDCQDADPSIHPGADEICNGVDDDCSGVEEVVGTGQACPAEDCLEVLTVNSSAQDDEYWLSPDGEIDPFEASCDMTTDEGGWTLVMNYVHLGSNNADLQVRASDLPLQSTSSLGDDDSGTDAWGHASESLLARFDIAETRWYCETTAHERVVHFKSPDTKCIDALQASVPYSYGPCRGVRTTVPFTNFPNPGGHTALAGHTGNLPAEATNADDYSANYLPTSFPFYKASAYHWGVHGAGGRWECDDFYPSSPDTIHRLWIR